MSSIRIRKPFAASFAILFLLAAYFALSARKIPHYGQSDKGLHLLTFFLLTLNFYWILELSRRRVIHLTLLTCTVGLALGSGLLRALLPNGAGFDASDMVADVSGSAIALLLSSWYHKRMLERRRKNKHYDLVSAEDGEMDVDVGDDLQRDIELGEGIGSQERGSIPAAMEGAAFARVKPTNVTDELDHWDENEEDWEEGADAAKGGIRAGPAESER